MNEFGQVFVLASAYYVGTEIIFFAAGETKDARKSIPRVSSNKLPTTSCQGEAQFSQSQHGAFNQMHSGQPSGD